MGRAALAAAWVLALLPGSLASLDPAWQLAPGSYLGWALVPWIALAGRPTADSGEHRTPPLVTWALALPTLALAARLDHAGGLTLAELGPTAAVGTVLLVLLATAGGRAARRPRLYAGLWGLAVPGVALAAWCLGLAGEVPAVLRTAADASPLTWALRSAAASASTSPASTWGVALADAALPLVVAVACLLVTVGEREA